MFRGFTKKLRTGIAIILGKLKKCENKSDKKSTGNVLIPENSDYGNKRTRYKDYENQGEPYF